MTYSKYRESFDNTEDFMLAFGQLTYEEAYALIDAEESSTTMKACMMTAWKKQKKGVRKYVVYK